MRGCEACRWHRSRHPYDDLRRWPRGAISIQHLHSHQRVTWRKSLRGRQVFTTKLHIDSVRSRIDIGKIAAARNVGARRTTLRMHSESSHEAMQRGRNVCRQRIRTEIGRRNARDASRHGISAVCLAHRCRRGAQSIGAFDLQARSAIAVDPQANAFQSSPPLRRVARFTTVN